LLTSDGALELQVDIELLEEEVIPERNLTQNETATKVEKLEQQVDIQTEMISNLQSSMQTQMGQITEMKAMMLAMSVAKTTPAAPLLECPVCMEVARPPMRLMQCGQGHIICDSCHNRVRSEANDWRLPYWERSQNLDVCPSCRQAITGRPSELERLLGLS